MKKPLVIGIIALFIGLVIVPSLNAGIQKTTVAQKPVNTGVREDTYNALLENYKELLENNEELQQQIQLALKRGLKVYHIYSSGRGLHAFILPPLLKLYGGYFPGIAAFCTYFDKHADTTVINITAREIVNQVEGPHTIFVFGYLTERRCTLRGIGWSYFSAISLWEPTIL